MAIRYYLLLFCMLFGIEADAQRFKRHEIDLSLGFGSRTGTQYDHFVGRMLNRYQLAESEIKDFNFDAIININADYMYSLTDKWSMGLAIGIGGVSRYFDNSCFIDDRTSPITQSASISTDIYYALPVLRYYWWEESSRLIRTYCQSAFGIVYQRNIFKPQDNETGLLQDHHEYLFRPAYQFTLLGVEFGRRDVLQFYSELGYGCLGVFRFGLKIVR